MSEETNLGGGTLLGNLHMLIWESGVWSQGRIFKSSEIYFRLLYCIAATVDSCSFTNHNYSI